MPTDHSASARLVLPLDMAFLPAATGFAEHCALALGLAAPEAMALTLASEEVFVHLTQNAGEANHVELVCLGLGYHVRLDFILPGGLLDMAAFNLTSSICLDDECSLDQMGLVIASRSVDRLDVGRDADGAVRLSLIKEKAYPRLAEAEPLSVAPLPAFTVRRPEPDEVKWLCRLLLQGYRPVYYPPDFAYPGKLVDMIGQGEFDALVAVGPTGVIGGGLFWQWTRAKAATLHGPYLFGQPPEGDMARRLVEACLEATGRGKAVGLLARLPTPQLPEGYFEVLGDYDLHIAGEAPRRVVAHFRQMQEDPGAVVWAHQALEPFLRQQYERMFLAREIRPVADHGEERPAHSLLAARLDRRIGVATLWPLQLGQDLAASLAAHLRLIRDEGLATCFFELDLGRSWQAMAAPDLLALGFVPRMVLPYHGHGDVVLLQTAELPE